MGTYDLVVIGCGDAAVTHLEACRKHESRVRVVAACDPNLERLGECCAKYGIGKSFSSVEDLLTKCSFDVAVVCTPTPLRLEIIKQLAEGEKHILVENPLADSLAEARKIVEVCEAAGVGLAVNQNYRYHYGFELAKTIVAEGTIGAVLGAVHQDLTFRQDNGWMARSNRHALAIMGVHWLDGFRWLLSKEAEAVVCALRSSPAIQCAGETEAFVHLRFPERIAVSYVQSFSSPMGRTETLIEGEIAMLGIDHHGVMLFEAGNRQTPLKQWVNPFGGDGKGEATFRCLGDLLDALEDGVEPPTSGRDNLYTVALLEACYRSAATGGVIDLKKGML